MSIELNLESVAAYKELITNPSKHGLPFPPMADIIVAASEPTAKHILFEQYLAVIKAPLPKLFFYIIMDEMYPQVKCADGNLGWNCRCKN